MADTSNNISDLERKIAAMDEEINDLLQQGYSDEELNLHIKKLHEYNEVKDVAQLILGKLAMMEGVTTKVIYSRYHLAVDD